MVLKVAKRGAVAPFLAMDMLSRANRRQQAGGEVVHLEVGQPGTPAPKAVLDAAARCLADGRIGYTEALGIGRLRESIARHYRDFYDVEVPAERIAVTTGSSSGFLLAFLAAFEPGDRVALATPYYPAYRNFLIALGLEPVLLSATAATGFHPTPGLLDAEPDLAGLIVASPANPTGSMLSPEELKQLVAYCADRGIRFISDEIYHGITFGKAVATVAELEPRAIVVNSFSKYFSMTGWRIGWLVLPEDLVRPVERLAQNLYISAPTLSQEAAIAALGCRAELDAYAAAYAEKRRFLLRELPGCGFSDFAPCDGAFYLYIDVGHLTNDSEDLCHRLLDEAGVALTPGLDFDPDRGQRYLRLSFAGPMADMEAAVGRLRTFFARG
jgi:aspartate/methionine/tyrosine aminotransferase